MVHNLDFSCYLTVMFTTAVVEYSLPSSENELLPRTLCFLVDHFSSESGGIGEGSGGVLSSNKATQII